MIVPPIIERELRVTLRQHESVKSRRVIAYWCAGLVAFFLFLAWLGVASLGPNLHEWLFYGGLFLAVIPPMQISAGLFSDERRNQTLELLYLAGLNPLDLFGGKLIAAILAGSGDLLAIMPFLAVPFLCGGVSMNLYLATIACFPTMLLFVVAAGTLASVLCADEGAALFFTIALISGFSVATPIPYHLGRLLAGAPPFHDSWLCLSPAYGPYLVWSRMGAGTYAEFWLGTLMTLAWAVMLFAVAALVLKRAWKHEIARAGQSGWTMIRPPAFLRSDQGRQAWRTRTLEANPFQWLAQHERRPVRLAWGIVLGVCGLWLLAWRAWPKFWLSPFNFYTTAVLLLIAMEMLMIYSATYRVGNDRQSGALELLLTTPLDPKEIADGQRDATQSQFRPICWTILGLCLLMMFGGFLIRPWITPAVISYVLVWCVILGWCLSSMGRRKTEGAMWIALNVGRPTLGLSYFQTMGKWSWIWVCFQIRNFMHLGSLGARYSFPSGSAIELILVSLMVFVFLVIGAVAQGSVDVMRGRLIGQMRLIAQFPPPERNDPRLKKWKNRQQPLPAA